MRTRITSTDFYKAVERLEESLNIKLTTNVRHKHYSVYTDPKERSVCQDKLVASDTAGDAIDQIWAILNTLSILEYKTKGRG